MIWPIVVCGLAVGTLALRLSGVLFAGRLALSPRVERLISMAATVMLCALVVSTTLSAAESQSGGYDPARIVGVAAAGLLVWRGAPLVAVVIAAAVVTAGLRWLGVG